MNTKKSEPKNVCPCKETYCPRNTNCAKCREYHHSTGSKTSCGK